MRSLELKVGSWLVLVCIFGMCHVAHPLIKYGRMAAENFSRTSIITIIVILIGPLRFNSCAHYLFIFINLLSIVPLSILENQYYLFREWGVK